MSDTILKKIWDRLRTDPMSVRDEADKDQNEGEHKALSASRGLLLNTGAGDKLADIMLNLKGGRNRNDTYVGKSAAESMRDDSNKAVRGYPKSNHSVSNVVTKPAALAASLATGGLSTPAAALADGAIGFADGYLSAPGGDNRVENGAENAGIAALGGLAGRATQAVGRRLGFLEPPPPKPPEDAEPFSVSKKGVDELKQRTANDNSLPVSDGPAATPHGKLNQQEIAWGAEWLKKNGIELPNNSTERDALVEWGYEQSTKKSAADALPLAEPPPLPEAGVGNDNAVPANSKAPHDFQREAFNRDASRSQAPTEDAASYAPPMTEDNLMSVPADASLNDLVSTGGNSNGMASRPPATPEATDIGERLRNLQPPRVPQIPEGRAAEAEARDAFNRRREPSERATEPPKKKPKKDDD